MIRVGAAPGPMRVVGVVLVLGGLLAAGIIFAFVREPPGSDFGDETPAAGSDGDLLVLESTVVVRTGTEGAAPVFRPQGGVVLGDEVVFLDSESSTLLILGADDVLRETRLELPTEGASREPQYTDVAATSNGSLLLSDLANGQIWQHSPDGRLLGGLLRPDQLKTSTLSKPTSVATDSEGRILVTDVGDQSVKVFNKAGDLVRSFGRAGFAQGEFDYPNDLVVGPEGVIYVADSNNRRIQVFDKYGSFERMFMDTDSALGLQLPRSLALDDEGRLHVADSFSERVWVFGLDGAYLGSYGASGPEEERLSLPEGLVVSGDRTIVGDRGNGCLRTYTP